MLSSGENAIPFGVTKSFKKSVNVPKSSDTLYTPEKSRSSSGSGAPGSVKYMVPSDLTMVSFGLFSRVPL